MKAVMMMFDSLNRAMLGPYGCRDVSTPNFDRLAQHSVRFDQCYAGSLPCMPARRELQTGRYNFLHRSWGPMEPYDDSMPQILDQNGVYTHLISDHTHYWEDGGSTYHNRYSSWENIRGQEGDKWKALPELMRDYREDELQNQDGQYFQATRGLQRHDRVNRQFMRREEDTCIARTVGCGLDFLDRNREADRYFLQIECFDPHEPFYVPDSYKALYPDEYPEKDRDWPPYHHVTETPLLQEHYKNQYRALLTMCDVYLGKLLDKFDELDLWKDTMLIVNTDHGYLLGEHGWWSKVVMPCYDEIVHTPLFIHDPRFACDGQSRGEIVQTVDLPATLLEFFGVPLPEDMQGRPIRRVIEEDSPIREYALFGIHGAHAAVFDGRYVYMKAPCSPSNQPLYEYTLMPAHMRNMFSAGELNKAKLTAGNQFTFTKGCPLLKIPKGNGNGEKDFSDLLIHGQESEEAKHIDNNSLVNAANFGDMLFDMHADPHQEQNLAGDAGMYSLAAKMANLLIRAMKENDCPAEQFTRLGLPQEAAVDEAYLERQSKEQDQPQADLCDLDCSWTRAGRNMWLALLRFLPKESHTKAREKLLGIAREEGAVTPEMIEKTAGILVPDEYVEMVTYFIGLAGRTS